MATNNPMVVKGAVHKLQLFLLEGIENEDRLFLAGSLMSRSDYEDVVCERSIANYCGYPLCKNHLPSERPRKGRYRISLKEHKVYDLHETYMYCNSNCVINSRTFATTLQERRPFDVSPKKIDDILKLFGEVRLESINAVVKNGGLGISELKIQEKMDTIVGEVTLEEWIGPSNAIEGYVPQIDRNSEHSRLKNQHRGLKATQTKQKIKNTLIINDMDFTSSIFEDEYSISKKALDPVKNESCTRSEGSKEKVECEHNISISEASSFHTKNPFGRKLRKSKTDVPNIKEVSLSSCQNGSSVNHAKVKEDFLAEKEAQFGEASMHKSSLKTSNALKHTRSVTWADEKVESTENKNLCEFNEVEESIEDVDILNDVTLGDDDKLRFASAEACAAALSNAAEAVASGESENSDAVSEAGIIILPPSHDGKIQSMEEEDLLQVDPVPTKWPTKPGISQLDVFNPEDSWFDTPPEGFSLALSPFATMWMTLFAWVTSSSMAFIYGQEESFHEEYLLVNGREYPRKIVLTDGRSSEIKQTIAGYLARVLPEVAGDLGLRLPISTLEKGTGYLLGTMTFVDSLPSFRLKQWQVIVLLFLEALSVCRIPTLTSHLTNKRMLLHKVLDDAHVTIEEYELMKDLMIPLGRAPQFSAQSGG